MTPDQRSTLLDSLLDGDISESDFLRIEAELIVDPEVRQEYYRRLQLDLLLEREAAESLLDPSAHPMPVAERVAAEHAAAQQFKSGRMLLLVGTLLAVAASLLIAVPLIQGVGGQDDAVAANEAAPRSPAIEEPSASGFAILSGQSEAVWEGATVGSGGLLPEGDLHLKSGLVHLELFSGVQVVI